MARIAILGAGIAGLSCAYLLQKQGFDTVVLEQRPYIGGLARSFRWHDFDCDFAAHRFYSNEAQVVQQILALVPMVRRARRSRLRVGGRWFHEPLNVLEFASSTLPMGPVEILLSYLNRSRQNGLDSFESFILEKYGRYLYHTFFRPYTEKLFGLAGNNISIEWAHRKARLANPLDTFHRGSSRKPSYFYYPAQGGYGSIANTLYQSVASRVLLNARAIGLQIEGQRIVGVIYEKAGQQLDLPVNYLIATLPLTMTVSLTGHFAPLSYRKMDAVYLWIDRPRMADYQWSYFIDADFTINRLVEFKNMYGEKHEAPDDTTVLCAEVTADCPNVVERVTADLERTGCIRREQILDTLVMHEEYAYPIYNQHYALAVSCARQILDRFKNLKIVGRAAEFEHREVADNFQQARNVVNAIVSDLVPITLVGRQRSS